MPATQCAIGSHWRFWSKSMAGSKPLSRKPELGCWGDWMGVRKELTVERSQRD